MGHAAGFSAAKPGPKKLIHRPQTAPILSRMSYDMIDWWDLAVQRNRAPLLRLVSVLFLMLGLDEGGADEVPRRVVRQILRLLRPAESAVRRLIVVAARGIRVEAPKLRQARAPDGISQLEAAGLLVIRRNVDLGLARFWRPEDAAAPKKPAPAFPAFSLTDPPHRFDALGWEGKRPFPQDGFAPADPDEELPARALCRRVQALRDALDNLPRYAQRLARREARIALASKSMKGGCAPASTGQRLAAYEKESAQLKGAHQSYRRKTLRLGHPPGHRRKPEREVDDLLRECHALALQAMAAPDRG